MAMAVNKLSSLTNEWRASGKNGESGLKSGKDGEPWTWRVRTTPAGQNALSQQGLQDADTVRCSYLFVHLHVEAV